MYRSTRLVFPPYSLPKRTTFRSTFPAMTDSTAVPVHTPKGPKGQRLNSSPGQLSYVLMYLGTSVCKYRLRTRQCYSERTAKLALAGPKLVASANGITAGACVYFERHLLCLYFGLETKQVGCPIDIIYTYKLYLWLPRS